MTNEEVAEEITAIIKKICMKCLIGHSIINVI